MRTRAASGQWSDLRQYRLLCYSDVVPLYGTEQLQGGRLPYLDHCEGRCDEYPLLTMSTMRAAAWAAHSYESFFYWNAVFFSIAAGVGGCCGGRQPPAVAGQPGARGSVIPIPGAGPLAPEGRGVQSVQDGRQAR
jgi:hypothetical protein